MRLEGDSAGLPEGEGMKNRVQAVSLDNPSQKAQATGLVIGFRMAKGVTGHSQRFVNMERNSRESDERT